MLKDTLKRERSNLGLSQLEFARRIGVSQQTVASWEVGRTSPDYEMLLKLSDMFETTTDYLLGKDIYPRKSKCDPEIVQIAKKIKDTPGMKPIFESLIRLSQKSMQDVRHFIEFQLVKEGKS